MGFAERDVHLALDARREELRRSVREFVESVKPGDLAFVYYSGHGVEVKGNNYLLPVDLPADATEDYVEDEAVSAQRILRNLTDQGARVRVLILDACRDNPLRAAKSTAGGLAPMEGSGSLIVFATEAGRTASDNPGAANSVFTQYLLQGLRLPGMSLDDAMKRVSRNVARATSEKQVPAIYGLLLEDVVLLPRMGNADKDIVAEGERLHAAGRYTDEVALYRRGAETGDGRAMAWLGSMYEAGTGVARDGAEAARWYRKSADAGDLTGKARLGISYAYGMGGLPKDEAEGFRLCRKAAEAGDAVGMGDLGALYYDGTGVVKDYSEAVRWMTRSAEAGNYRSATNLGNWYRTGDGVPADQSQALSWYRKAAEAGDAVAMNTVGFMYGKGLGVPTDYAEAVRWFQRAAEAGDLPAMTNPGRYYRDGRGVSKDLGQAEKWFRKAVDLGYANAKTELEALEKTLHP